MALKIKEKEIEDAICENIEDFFYEGAVIIGRQIRLPHGILDVLAWTGRATAIIEIKAVALQEKDVGQVLRYTYDVRTFIHRAQMELLSKDYSPREARTRLDDLFVNRCLAYSGVLTNDEMLIQPMLIGKAGSETVIAAANGAHIETYEWAFDESNNSFTFRSPRQQIWPDMCAIPQWANTISKLSSTSAKGWANWQFRSEIGRLFSSIPNFGGISE